MAKMTEVEKFQWEVIHDLQSDHLPIKITWKKSFEVEKEARTTEWNIGKADWSKYREYISQHMEAVREEAGMKSRYGLLIGVIKKAARDAIPLRPKRKDRNIWVTAEIKRLRRERNELRRNIAVRRDEWVEKCRELVEKTREAKRRVWRNNLERIRESKDITEAWALVRGLSGTRKSGESKAIVYNNRRCATNKAKANAFVQEYAEVSSRKSTKGTRREAVEINNILRQQEPREEIGEDFKYSELAAATRKIKKKKAAGPDDLSSDMVRELPESALRELLAIFNYSWREEWIPQDWRSATVIPIPKQGKDPSKVGSFRPIALTSHIGKLMERLVTTRLTWWLEHNEKISPLQAGYRRGRSTTDQCLRLSQTISDGFQKAPPGAPSSLSSITVKPSTQ
jgi:hypothetical protein